MNANAATAANAANAWNGCHFDPTRGGHVESWFLKLNDPAGARALWLKATIRNPDPRFHAGGPVAESWAIAFERRHPPRGAKHVVPYAQAGFSALGLDLSVADLRWQDGHISGAVVGDRHAVTFDLRYTDPGPALVPLPSRRMYSGPFPSSKFVSPAPDARFDGHYALDGHRVEVQGWRGMQGHNWGRRHAHRYAWGHCNQWHGHDDLWFEGVTAQVKIGPVTAPPLTLLCVSHRGVRYLFNTGTDLLLRARGEFDLRRWTFRAENALAAVEGELEADAPDFAGLRYDNPSGPPTFCLNSKIARGRLRLHIRGRAPFEAETHSAALEIGTHDAHHGVVLLA